ncbi:hypothetical protein C7212DRAFT_328576 [Tuber magnatum]|uniref:Uncharacterized protein n=1 Tax=Tuber magnatum TaxID=42249 RepID=A0A317SJT6_9PEZI|nr:hypothetical protein C7212DRAFT_328576 [Tuber magnatum]
MSAMETDTIEKKFKELQKKYIDLRMNARVVEQELKHWKSQAKNAERGEMGMRYRVEEVLKEKKKLEIQLERAEYGQVKLNNILKISRRDNEVLRDKVERGEAEILKGQEKINQLAQMVEGMTVRNEQDQSEEKEMVQDPEGEVMQEEWERAAEEYKEMEYPEGEEPW